MQTVTGPGLPPDGANYGYLTNSPLLESTQFKQGEQVLVQTIPCLRAAAGLDRFGAEPVR